MGNPFVDFAWSACVLSGLIYARKEVTPDLMHFITCMVDEEADFMWIMFLWLTRKCFLTMDASYQLLN